jgi:crotonobetainyl-CoA:carnitine CoA-transferase CaiB-like acyl-CoA transferase
MFGLHALFLPPSNLHSAAALALDPNDPFNQVFAATYLATAGKREEAMKILQSCRRAMAGDGKVVAVTANTENMFRGLVRVLGFGELAKDPRFVDAASRYKNREALIALLNDAFARSSSANNIVDPSQLG